MFDPGIFKDRRKILREKVGSGLILLLGNDESPMNYTANIYPFRQDGNFRYFFGLEKPGLIGLLDPEEGKDYLFGPEITLEDVVWMGPQPSLGEISRNVGVEDTGTLAQLSEKVKFALSQGRKIHFTPPYRGEQAFKLEALLGIQARNAHKAVFPDLIKSIVELRSVKSGFEIAEIETALETTSEAFAVMAKSVKPGLFEYELSGKIEGLFASRNRTLAYPIILSVHGETLHNNYHGNKLQAGDLLIIDAGAESPLGYASDITRTFPVSGRFSPAQKDIYHIVLKAQTESLSAIRPGVPYKDVHVLASKIIASGLKAMGLMQGNVDDAVNAGAHALFFPHGLGHMLGLDVHDMEGLGEDFVGYDSTVARSSQFGLSHLRLAKALQAGNVLTVEPGIYFIPALIDQWKSGGKHSAFINYDKVDKFRKAGGTRIEDDVLVTETGSRVLGKPIPKTVEEVEASMASPV